MRQFLNSISFCGDAAVLLQGDSVVQYYVFFLPDGLQRVSVLFDLRTFVKVSFGGVRAFADGHFSIGPCLAPRLLSFLIKNPGTEVTSRLFWSTFARHISSTTAKDYISFPVGIAVKTLLFGRIFTKFEDFGFV